MFDDRKRLYNLDVQIEILEGEKSICCVKNVEKPKSKEYDFSIDDLKRFSKAHLIWIICVLREEINRYKRGV